MEKDLLEQTLERAAFPISIMAIYTHTMVCQQQRPKDTLMLN